jgi:ATP-dependent helicase/nuclease subunit A
MPLTDVQREAVAARGNVIVVAGAGTGKTSTLVSRCLDVVQTDSSLDRILMVTFTEAAAAEMRHRLRVELQTLADEHTDSARQEQFAEQLALVETARISTIHSFCLRLVQAHFHELGLDPEVKVLDEQQCRLITLQTLDDLMEECYSGESPFGQSAQSLIAAYGQDRDSIVRSLVLKLHRHAQSLAHAGDWIRRQRSLWAVHSPVEWPHWLANDIQGWQRQWLAAIRKHEGVKNIDDCLTALSALSDSPSLSAVRTAANAICAAEKADWQGLKTKVHKPLVKFFDEAAFLASVADAQALQGDWDAVRGHMDALLALSQEFTARFTRAKREMGGMDFPDLEQLCLQLLLNEGGTPTAVAEEWRSRLDYVFVDECQDVNGAQDAILAAVSREGARANRFLVGDVKQSIYQFRLADPEIFRGYENAWGDEDTGQRLSLTENFRSRPGLLDFVNTLFGGLMRSSFGGVDYEPLRAGNGSDAPNGSPVPCAELHLLGKASSGDNPSTGGADDDLADLSSVEREARLVAARLRHLRDSQFTVRDKEGGGERPVEWGDMAILMRSPGPRTEAFAKIFHQAGIPLAASRGGFLDAVEVSDLVSLLQLLDNPLQDIPLLAVLRSPLVGVTIDELAVLRGYSDARPFWFALQRYATDSKGEFGDRIRRFLEQYAGWRQRVRQIGPSLCLERILTDTNYDLLLGANDRGQEQLANVRRLLDLSRQFDPYLRQGLFRFLRFLDIMEDADDSLAPASVSASDAVRLISIHRSKGLEFPVVVLAGLGARFNLQDAGDLVLLDSEFGLAPKAATPDGCARFPTLPFWLAERRLRARRLGEELRLLYVALTRARDHLICTGTLSRKDQGRWVPQLQTAVTDHDLLSARSPMDWLMSWLPTVTEEAHWENDLQGACGLLRWELWSPFDSRLELAGVSEVDSAPEMRCIQPDSQVVEAVAARLSRVYEHALAAAEPAKSSVSALRRQALELDGEEAVQRFDRLPSPPSSSEDGGQISAVERGVVQHRFLQLISIKDAHSREALARKLEELLQCGVFSEEEAAMVDLTAVATFWASDIGQRICAESESVQREIPFTARFGDIELRQLLGQKPSSSKTGEFVVVQGVVDLAVIGAEEVWVLDFKTDAVDGELLESRAKAYEPQLQLYSMALERIYRKPVYHRWLHFLAADRTVEFAPAHMR